MRFPNLPLSVPVQRHFYLDINSFNPFLSDFISLPFNSAAYFVLLFKINLCNFCASVYPSTDIHPHFPYYANLRSPRCRIPFTAVLHISKIPLH